jgi:hypothetical protein
MEQDGQREQDVRPLAYAALGDGEVRLRPQRVRWWIPLSVVATILAGLLFLPPFFVTQTGWSNTDLARQLVSNGGALATQITLYRQNTGQHPTTLKDLTTRPADPAVAARWGNQPYIHDPSSLMDPWAGQLQYRIPGVHNPTGFDLWSMGPDGVSGTADDIGNW